MCNLVAVEANDPTQRTERPSQWNKRRYALGQLGADVLEFGNLRAQKDV